MKLILVIVALLATNAYAQTQPWDTNVIVWRLPTTCVDGQPITACPLSSVQLERSAASGGPFAPIATLASDATTYSHVNAQAGVNCYRIRVTGSAGMSDPSNIHCKTNTAPPPPTPVPSPPSDLRIVTPPIAGLVDVPVFTVLANGSRSTTIGGFTTAGTPCEGPVLFRYRSRDWRKPVTFKPWGVSASARVAAPCA